MVRNAWSSADALQNVGHVQNFLNSSVVGAPRVWTLSDTTPAEPTGRVCEMGRCLSGPGSLAPPTRRFNGTTCPASAHNCAPLAHDEWLANKGFWTKNASKVGELIFATTNTVLKKSTAQSDMLPPSELLRVHEGFPCRLLAPTPWANYWLCNHGGSELKTDDSDTALPVFKGVPIKHDDVMPWDGDGGGIAVPAAGLSSQITHFVFISHPLLYEAMPAATIAKTNAGIYQVWERAVKATSLASIGALAPTSFVVQLNGGSDAFVTAATAKLGASQVLKLGAASSTFSVIQRSGPSVEAPTDPRQWLGSRAPINFTAMYEGFASQTKTHLSQHGLAFDAATATSEFWGESFEGCVPGYGSGWATAMGLRTKGVMMFDHTVADARFMYRAVHTETVAVGGSDVDAMVFRLADNASVACAGSPVPPSAYILSSEFKGLFPT